MQNQQVIRVFVGFVRGVAMALPQWASDMINAVGAKPAERIYIKQVKPEVIVRSHATVRVVGGTSIKGSGRRDPNDCEPKLGSSRSWKFYRARQYRTA
jgi:hypothetical protein